MNNLSRSILLLICLTVLFASFVGAQEKQSSDLFQIKLNGKYGFIDKIQIGKKYGFVNKKGKIIVKPKFDYANSFTNGLARVGTKEGIGYIDKTGKYIWQPTK